MKNIIIKGLLIMTIPLSLSSCQKNFEEINDNPNNPTEVPSEMLYPDIMLRAAFKMQLSAGLMTTDLWVQHTRATTYMDEDTYNARTDRMDLNWADVYTGPINNSVYAIEKAQADGKPNHQAIAMILKAYTGYYLTSLFGDVPYSEAGQGASKNIILPKYDKQQDIFNKVISELDQAIGLIDPNKSVLGLATYDLIYGGNLDKWKKFANSLKLRVYLSLTAGGVDKKAEITALLNSNNVFTSNDDNAVLNYYDAPSSNSNPVYQWTNAGSSRRDDFRLSGTLVNYMYGDSKDSSKPADPRLKIYAEPLANGKYVGSRNGVSGSIVTNSKVGATFYKASSPTYFLTYAEVLFIKAELDPTQSNYEAAIKASLEQNGITDFSMLTNPAFAWNPAKAQQLIGEQKWVALFGQGVEAFNSWRRSGYPKLTPAANATTVTGKVPRRFVYNTEEKTLNGANLSSGVQALSPASDRISSKVWFDRNHADDFGNN